jgi:uncharacterized protein (DUF934 family)
MSKETGWTGRVCAISNVAEKQQRFYPRLTINSFDAKDPQEPEETVNFRLTIKSHHATML